MPAASDDFADSLATPLPAAPLRPANPGLLAVLLLICLLPRAFMAAKVDVLVPDGAYYIAVARELSQGNLEQAFGKLHLNLYPIVLSLLHAVGLDWETAGEWWSVCMATLVVLPLFGLVRRQFNDRVAIFSCWLYAVHPGLIEWGVEVIRDPTFWFLCILTLHLSWRAITEVRLPLFLGAGAALTLAIHVRFEGWALLFPLAMWTAWRSLALIECRRRLVAGALLCVGILPVFLVAVNLTWLRHLSHWELGRFSHLQLFSGDRLTGSGSSARNESPLAARSVQDQKLPRPSNGVRPAKARSALDSAGNNSEGRSPQRLPTTTGSSYGMASIYFERLVDAFSPAFGLLFLVGMWKYRVVFFRRSNLAIFSMNLALLAAIWLYLSRHHLIDGRYFLPTVITAAPYAALGLLAAAAWLADWCGRFAANVPTRKIVVVLVMAVALIGCADALSTDLADRRQPAEVGRWILREFGPGRKLMENRGNMLVAHYAQAAYVPIPTLADCASVRRRVAQNRPDVVLLWPRSFHTGDWNTTLARHLAKIGFEPIPPTELTAATQVCVFRPMLVGKHSTAGGPRR